MLKKIPKSDISIRPFKAYKEWSFTQDSTQVSLLEATEYSDELAFENASVKIGEQLWTQKNLSVTRYKNGDPITQVNDPSQWIGLTEGAWCYVNNDPNTVDEFGLLYNWYAVDDPRGLAPDGYHIPTETEFEILGEYLFPGNYNSGNMGYVDALNMVSGKWQSAASGIEYVTFGDSSTGLNMMANYRIFTGNGETIFNPAIGVDYPGIAYFWTSTAGFGTNGRYFGIEFTGAGMVLDIHDWYISTVPTEKTDGISVRLIKDTVNEYTFSKKSIYGQLRAQFYKDNEDNPFLRSGRKTNVWTDTNNEKERYLSGSAKIISIPQKYTGEGIKPKSVKLNIKSSNGQTISFEDDGYSNLKFAGTSDLSVLDVQRIDVGAPSLFYFTNYATGTPYSASNLSVDLLTGDISFDYSGSTYNKTFYSWDSHATPALMYISNLPFLDIPEEDRFVAGNVFYSQGLITITRNSNNLLNGDWDLSYKSTETIYEHEYLCIVNEDEFNISCNPTAVYTVGEERDKFMDSDGVLRDVVTNPGIKYIRKKQVLETGDYMNFGFTGSISSNTEPAGFEHWDTSGSIDITGSFLAPYITTIGLYDDNSDLVLVAKLPKPIKSFPDIPINFIVRFDT